MASHIGVVVERKKSISSRRTRVMASEISSHQAANSKSKVSVEKAVTTNSDSKTESTLLGLVERKRAAKTSSVLAAPLKPFSCDICRVTFNSERYYKMHMRVHKNPNASYIKRLRRSGLGWNKKSLKRKKKLSGQFFSDMKEQIYRYDDLNYISEVLNEDLELDRIDENWCDDGEHSEIDCKTMKNKKEQKSRKKALEENCGKKIVRHKKKVRRKNKRNTESNNLKTDNSSDLCDSRPATQKENTLAQLTISNKKNVAKNTCTEEQTERDVVKEDGPSKLKSKKKVHTVPERLTCYICDISFGLKSNMKRHIQHFHERTYVENYVGPRLKATKSERYLQCKCDLCRSFNQKLGRNRLRSLKNIEQIRKRREHESVTIGEEMNHACDELHVNESLNSTDDLYSSFTGLTIVDSVTLPDADVIFFAPEVQKEKSNIDTYLDECCNYKVVSDKSKNQVCLHQLYEEHSYADLRPGDQVKRKIVKKELSQEEPFNNGEIVGENSQRINLRSKKNKRKSTKRVNKTYTCEICQISFSSYQKFGGHQLSHHHSDRWPCSFCSKIFKQEHWLKKHTLSCHTTHKCNVCGKTFSLSSDFKKHKVEHESHMYDVCRRAVNEMSNLSLCLTPSTTDLCSTEDTPANIATC